MSSEPHSETIELRWTAAALRKVRHESEHSMDPRTRRRLTEALTEIQATPAPHYHCATGQENTPCLCDQPGTYARQAPNPIEIQR